MNNRVIKEQYNENYKKNYYTDKWEYVGANNLLSNLYLSNECIPFDIMPFVQLSKNMSLIYMIC